MQQQIRINLGCGTDYKEGYVNVDYADIKKDVKHNLLKFPYPFKTGSADYIVLHNVVEHLPIPIQSKTIMECHRILKRGGVLHITVPHFTGVSVYENIEHIKGYSYETMHSFVEKGFTNSQKDYMQKQKYATISCKIVFGKKYQIWNWLIESFANCFPTVYETSFLRVFPAEEMHYKMVK